MFFCYSRSISIIPQSSNARKSCDCNDERSRYIENVRRYNQLGANGLKDKRHQHPGTQPLLSVVEQAQMKQTLRTPTADGGLWNSRKVAEWMSNIMSGRLTV
jgi:hypothetical protein